MSISPNLDIFEKIEPKNKILFLIIQKFNVNVPCFMQNFIAIGN